ncbi:MAG: gamma-glutamyl-gamma-aminobutyrate hydrolase family protein [Myxococcota bacterium]
MKHHGHARRPSIGITPDLSSPQPEQTAPRYELKTAYADAVQRSGGLPLILAYADDHGCIDTYLDRIFGLVLTGGAFDIPPEAYGETPREGLGPLKRERTQFETAMLQGALARNLPVLGICGGMQLLNVVLGGTLYQDLARELPTAKSHQQEHDRSQPHHPVEVKEGTRLAEVMGKGQVMVNSTHHQAVKKVGEKVVVSALAPDGVVEAIESTAHAFAVGVQWHPELLVNTVPANLGLYRALVNKARDGRR